MVMDEEITKPALEKPSETEEEEPIEPVDRGRRWLLTRLALGGAAAFGLGGGAALLINTRRRTVIVLPNGEEIEVQGDAADVADLAAQIDTLAERLGVISAERDRLSDDLAEAYEEIEALQTQLTTVTADRDQAQQLNNLWAALDAVGLDDILAGALVTVEVAWLALSPLVEALRDGLARGRDVLQIVMDAFPGPQEGIHWLQEQVNELAENLAWLAEQVSEVVEPLQPLADAIAQFILWVLEHLPFGIGRDAQAGLEAMQTIVGGLPDLVEGINGSVLDPLADWFGQNVGTNLLGTLINPLLDNVFNPAGEMLDKLGVLDTDYETALAGPVQQALSNRAAIRAQIAEQAAATQTET